MQWEVEQKFALDDIEAARAKLTQLGARFSEPIEQADRYFNHPARDFEKTDEALRLRQAETGNFITYKGPRIDSHTKTREELELPLPPGTDIWGQFADLLMALGFRPVATVKKTRCPGYLSWEGQQVDVALDQVEGVGYFLELEILADEAAFEAAKAALIDLSARLGLGKSERRSYLELLLFKSL